MPNFHKGGTLTNLIDPLKKSLFQTISWGGSWYLKVINPFVWVLRFQLNF